ncbi:MAG: ABC transporter permease [Bacillota bacterium]
MIGSEKVSSTNFLKNVQFKKILTKSGLWIIFIILVIIASILSPRFLTYNNIFNVLRQISILGILAVGMTFVIISGGIDLSVGGVMAFSCVLVPLVSPYVGNNITLICLVNIFVGMILGIVTGSLVSFGKMQPFMATFGMATIAEGLGFFFSDGRPIILDDKRWTAFGSGATLSIPNMAIIFIIAVIIGQFVISKTCYGLNTYAIGNNEVATSLCGVNTRITKMVAYIISGTLAAVGGLMMTARIGVGDPGVGVGYSLDTIAAVIVGGTRMGGGYGSILNTFLGTCIIGLLNNVFNLAGISPYPQMIFKGMIIIFAVLMGQIRKK